jgi:hypothetical protein
MTPKQRGGAPPPGDHPASEDASRHDAAEHSHRSPAVPTPRAPEPAVVGVVELALADFDFRSVRAGMRVRVYIGSGWVDTGDLSRLAAATYGVPYLEIAGPDSLAVSEAVRVVRRHHADYRRLEAADAMICKAARETGPDR